MVKGWKLTDPWTSRALASIGHRPLSAWVFAPRGYQNDTGKFYIFFFIFNEPPGFFTDAAKSVKYLLSKMETPKISEFINENKC